ncbi:hypothetical protein FGG15_12885 [Flagellimonas algicola]|uniref:Uncharacterized protein n=1 Tax=Flagellimonas algicola TaxID=2583815 RepID=A0ABY2WLR0_9FLAO|nr:hypothetical protein FGG15_12885 [Allomuricauda algicola]
MSEYQYILDKLEDFTKKFYTKRLIKGILLFLSLGLLFWILVLSLEYMLWLNQQGRLVLLGVFIVAELVLLYRFVVVPLIFLFGLRKGISNRDAAKIISIHFHDVGDRLHNLLDLADDKNSSELLLASIDQRAKSLKPIPFARAVKVMEGFGYWRYLLIPAVILVCFWILGDIGSFMSSHSRIVNYDVAYERPAPFEFVLLNDKLEVLDGEPLEIKLRVVGDAIPDDVFMMAEGKEILMKRDGSSFIHLVNSLEEDISFHFSANGWDSRVYEIRRLERPVLRDFVMKLRYPSYLGMPDDVISGTGNGVVPEGTKIDWIIEGSNVQEVSFSYADTLISMNQGDQGFQWKRQIFEDFSYEVSTSNGDVRDFERLGYEIEVVKDAYPTLDIRQVVDSLNPNVLWYSGLANDDHGIREIRVVCTSIRGQKNLQKRVLERPKTAVREFYYTFPSGLKLESGEDYLIYFEVVDNDGIRGGKVSRSGSFRTRMYDDKELKNKELENSRQNLRGLERSLEEYKNNGKAVREFSKKDVVNKQSSFEKEGEIRELLQKQQAQELMMEKFAKDLKQGVSESERNDEFKRMLEERLKRQELEARKNRRLLEELNKIADKIDKVELKSKLEELGKKQSSGSRNLEQILELTKRYYVTEKMKQLSLELGKLSNRQMILSDMKLGDKLDDRLQRQLNNGFEELSKEVDELRKDNQDLRKPVGFDVSPKDQNGVKKDQQDALEEINKHQGIEHSSDGVNVQKAEDNIRKKQKSAAQKMREISEALGESSSGGGGSDIVEDAEMLRQVLDNLVVFSFKQEKLFDKVSESDADISRFSETVRDQKELRRLFEHVDDSLFALSLRRVELSEFVNEEITEVYYNIDKALESIADNQIYKGASYQQYVINATNSLAEFLADVLGNMQQSMKPGQGGGQGSDFQLPDIIKGQQSIKEQMNGSSGQGKSGQDGEQGGESEGKNGGEDGGKNGKQEGGKEEGEEGGNGSEGNGSRPGSQNSSGQGDELGLNKIYEIYKQQQALRKELEQQLNNLIENSDRNLTKKLVRQMEEFENDLLENGITERTQNKVNQIQHELLKLENAALKQGEKKERESKTTEDEFSNPITTKPSLLNKGTNNVEILNRQALPLRRNYENKVKGYFNND